MFSSRLVSEIRSLALTIGQCQIEVRVGWRGRVKTQRPLPFADNPEWTDES